MAHPVLPPDQKLYFPYGSNLSLQQMARRCPDSYFYGLATPHGYRSQINNRGVANLVNAIDHQVHGLLYLVTPQDEAALDVYEYVAGGFYQKHLPPVQLVPHSRYAGWPTEEVDKDLARGPADS